MEKYLSISAACKRYCIGKSSLYKLINAQSIVAKKFGVKTLIDRVAADEFFHDLPGKTQQ